jgi:hypothetical protein
MDNTVREKSLEELRDLALLSYTHNPDRVQLEFTFRTTKAALAASEAQRGAAEAATRTAEATERYVKYMLWSVLALALGEGGQLLVALFK